RDSRRLEDHHQEPLDPIPDPGVPALPVPGDHEPCDVGGFREESDDVMSVSVRMGLSRTFDDPGLPTGVMGPFSAGFPVARNRRSANVIKSAGEPRMALPHS